MQDEVYETDPNLYLDIGHAHDQLSDESTVLTTMVLNSHLPAVTPHSTVFVLLAKMALATAVICFRANPEARKYLYRLSPPSM